MAKITLNNLTSLQNEGAAISTINLNNDAIEAAVENTLSRDGTTPNQMTAVIDMNSNRIVNLGAPVNPNDAARLVDAAGSSAASAAAAAASAAAALVSQNAASVSAGLAVPAGAAAVTSAANALTSETNAANSATVVAGNFYNFDSATAMADPGSADIRFNNATLASVTGLAVSVNTADLANPSIRAFLASWDDSVTSNRGFIQIRKVGTPATYVVFNVTGALTDNTTWIQFVVTHNSSNGTFANTDKLSVQFTRNGADGSGVTGGAANQIAVYSGAGAITGGIAVLTDGQLVVGQTSAAPLGKTVSGDATMAATGALTIANDAVTYAKMQNVSATSRVLGRITAGAGDTEELTGANVATILGGNVSVLQAPGNWKLLHTDGSGVVTTVALGATGTALVSTGATSAPTVQAVLQPNVTASLTAGYTSPSVSAGTKSSGTYTFDPTVGAVQHVTNGGAHTFAPPVTMGSWMIDYINNASAGAITVSGWTKVDGDAFTLTNGNSFRCYLSVGNQGSHMNVKRMV